MGKALSQDLRDRVVAAIDGGLSRCGATARFGVSVSSATRCHQLARGSMDARLPESLAVTSVRRRRNAHAGQIMAMLEEQGDITLAEFQFGLAGHGISVGIGSLWRFFNRHGITRKKRPGTRSGRTAPMS